MATKAMVKCPQCSKRLSRQGLNGHLRFVHGIGAEDLRPTMRQAPVEDRAARVLELIQRLGEVRKKREAIDDWWWPAEEGEDESRKVSIQACDSMEAEILSELRNFGMRQVE